MTMPGEEQGSTADKGLSGLSADEIELFNKHNAPAVEGPAKQKGAKKKGKKHDGAKPGPAVFQFGHMNSLGTVSALSRSEVADLDNIDGAVCKEERYGDEEAEDKSADEEEASEEEGDDAPADIAKLLETLKRRDARIEKLERKNRELSEERTTARKDLDAMTKRFNIKVEEVKEKDREIEDLKSQLREARSKLQGPAPDRGAEIEQLHKTVSDREADIKSLQRENKTLLSDKESLERSLRSAQEARDDAIDDCEEAADRAKALESRISELEGELAIALASSSAPRGKMAVKVRRISGTALESEAFTEPRYKMMLSRDGHRLTFSADVEGKVVNIGGRVNIPRLPSLIPFEGEAEYDAYTDDGRTYLMNIRERRMSAEAGNRTRVLTLARLSDNPYTTSAHDASRTAQTNWTWVIVRMQPHYGGSY